MYESLIHPEDTIVAIATPQGVGAIGLIRVSGEKTFEIVQKVFKGKRLSDQSSHTIHYGHIVDGAEVLDEVMCSVFKSPKSFTTEDSVEISCHGSSYIQSRILNALIKNGARLAAPGEFTLRAYLNGRIDLAQAEAVGDMIAAQNKSQLDLALNQMRGGLSKRLNELRERLLNFISLIELELDFGEEDVEFADRVELKNRLNEMLNFIQPMADSFTLGNAIKNGIPVAIVGRPNAGKSSLLNALLEDDRAIVSDIAGTTRDTIEEEIHYKGVSFRFIDTAGIRHTEDVIEKIGIEKALKTISRAQIVIYIFDMSSLSNEEILQDLKLISDRNPTENILALGNKKDLANANRVEELTNLFGNDRRKFLSISAKDDQHKDLVTLRDTLFEIMHLGEFSSSQTIISNIRHYEALKEASAAINEVLNLMTQGSSGDILSLEMKRALNSIGDITGTISNDEVLGNIFGKFCIGK